MSPRGEDICSKCLKSELGVRISDISQKCLKSGLFENQTAFECRKSILVVRIQGSRCMSWKITATLGPPPIVFYISFHLNYFVHKSMRNIQPPHPQLSKYFNSRARGWGGGVGPLCQSPKNSPPLVATLFHKNLVSRILNVLPPTVKGFPASPFSTKRIWGKTPGYPRKSK